jgi:hypothetical protein
MRIEAAVIASEIGLGAANAPGPPSSLPIRLSVLPTVSGPQPTTVGAPARLVHGSRLRC